MGYSQSLSGISELSQGIVVVVAFISIVLFAFMIYVGICIIMIKNDVRQLTDLEFKKYKESCKKVDTSNEMVSKEKAQNNELSTVENIINNK